MKTWVSGQFALFTLSSSTCIGKKTSLTVKFICGNNIVYLRQCISSSSRHTVPNIVLCTGPPSCPGKGNQRSSSSAGNIVSLRKGSKRHKIKGKKRKGHEIRYRVTGEE